MLNDIIDWEPTIKNPSKLKSHGIQREDLERQLKTANHLIKRLFHEEMEVQLLADEVGMGKTYVALAVMAYFLRHNKNKKVLLITPANKGLQLKWRQDIETFNSYLINKKNNIFRPAVIEDFADFTDYAKKEKNETISRITEPQLRNYFILTLYNWKIEKNPNINWDVWRKNAQFESDDWDNSVLQRFSEAGLRQYFSKNFSEINKITSLLNEKNCVNQIHECIKDYLKNKIKYAPNLFILRMNHLKSNNKKSEASRIIATICLKLFLKGKSDKNKEKIIRAVQKYDMLRKPKLEDIGKRKIKSPYIQEILDYPDHLGIANIFEKFASKNKWVEEWNENYYGPILKNENVEKELGNFFRDKIIPTIIDQKIQDCNIGFAVVDEVHNWKSGIANGAKIFQETYSQKIQKKLVMSATPFQIVPEELETILDITNSSDNGHIAEMQKKLFKESKLIDKTRELSKEFEHAWKNLSQEDIDYLHTFPNDSKIREIAERINSDSISLRRFLNKANQYKEINIKLEEQFRKLMVRHIKEKSYRDFHSGQDFQLEDLKTNQNNKSIYAINGYISKNESQAFFEYVAMRFEQLTRMQGNEKVNAHLLGGLTSSFKAFEESLENKKKKTSGLSEDAQKYQGIMDSSIKNNPNKLIHSKVEATVKRVIKNWKENKKSLVFCNRIKTIHELHDKIQEEIDTIINQRLEPFSMLTNWDQFLKKETFFREDRLWLSFLYKSSSDSNVKNSDLYRNTEKYLNSSEFTENFFKLMSYTDFEESLDLRSIRIIDLLCMNKFKKILCKDKLKNLKLDDIEENASEFIKYGYDFLEKSKDIIIDDEIENEKELQIGKGISKTKSLKDLLEGAEIKVKEENYKSKIADYLSTPCIWFYESNHCKTLHANLWNLLEDEIENDVEFFFKARKLFVTGLRKMILRKDLVALYLFNQKPIEKFELSDIVHGFYCDSSDSAIIKKVLDYLEILKSSKGFIHPNAKDTKRFTLWSGIYLKAKSEASPYLKKLDGETDQNARLRICSAFNSPLLPDILLCSTIGQEGIDLHLYCSEIIHHDLPWNPAILEQRTGRIDRVNSLTERIRKDNPNYFLKIGIPFLGNNYEQFHYDTLVERAQSFQILMGDPMLKKHLEESYDAIGSEEKNELVKENPELYLIPTKKWLPNWLVEDLRMDFSLK